MFPENSADGLQETTTSFYTPQNTAITTQVTLLGTPEHVLLYKLCTFIFYLFLVSF